MPDKKNPESKPRESDSTVQAKELNRVSPEDEKDLARRAMLLCCKLRLKHRGIQPVKSRSKE